MLLYPGLKEEDSPNTQEVVLMLSKNARNEILSGNLMDPGSSKHHSKQRRLELRSVLSIVMHPPTIATRSVI
ncbi:unnamed protein product [Schistosoma curassoni]|uniref:Ovule protein n=1 Tax=Schistosoma curassoni TaxID=6186 RepID=A0A183JL61_9TREM|nr:unnamed protein product [Schistosoma curassoni]